MRIETDVDLLPNIQKYLSSIDDNALYYKQHNIKHPSALYNFSISKIETSLKQFLELYKIFDEEEFNVAYDKNGDLILKEYRNLLYCFREHFDDCLHVIKCFVPPPVNEKKDKNQYGWLEKNVKPVVEDFFNNISEYKKYIDSIVNELKHNNGTLCSVAFYSSTDLNKHCLGYFVANVINGAYQPIETIHPKFENTITAFSFKRDLAYNLFNIYKISEEIMTLLINKFSIDFSIILPKTCSAPEVRQDMFKNLKLLSSYYFPDEYVKPVPKVFLNKKHKLELEYPSLYTIKPNKLDKIVAKHSGDGHTREFKIPYLK